MRHQPHPVARAWFGLEDSLFERFRFWWIFLCVVGLHFLVSTIRADRYTPFHQILTPDWYFPCLLIIGFVPVIVVAFVNGWWKNLNGVWKFSNSQFGKDLTRWTLPGVLYLCLSPFQYLATGQEIEAGILFGGGCLCTIIGGISLPSD